MSELADTETTVETQQESDQPQASGILGRLKNKVTYFGNDTREIMPSIWRYFASNLLVFGIIALLIFGFVKVYKKGGL